MNIPGSLSVILFLVLCSGCAGMYEGLRQKQEQDCYSLQGIERDQCLNRSSMSYDEYQKRLKERDEKK